MDFQDLERKLKMSDPQDVKDTINSVKEDKKNKINKFCATEDLTNRKMGSIPTDLYFHCLRKYGKDKVNSKSFWHEFFDTMKVFSTMDKI